MTSKYATTRVNPAGPQPVVVDTELPSATALAGRYLVLSLLGGGGMGRVYLARDTELDELVAVKMLLRETLEQPGVLEQLRSEVKLARRVTHPNVVRTFDIGIHEGQRFITLEYVDGESLAAVLTRGRLSVPVFLATARALCDGLAAAHAVGVVHRDLKPANVLVGEGGRVALTDFGIACLAASHASTMAGTPQYMAPEQLAGGAVDRRTDIYALGLLFFEMLTGRRPFAGQDARGEVGRRLAEQAPDLTTEGVPEAIARIVRTAMSADPEARYSGAHELKVELTLVTTPPEALPVEVGRRASSARSVAVLAPHAVGDVPQGLDEHLADALRRIGLRVPSASAVAPLLGQAPRQVGQALDVDAVLELTLRREAGDLDVEARLLGVADGIVLLSLRMGVVGDQLMHLAEQLVAAVGEALRARVPQEAMSAAVLDDPEALALYTEARRFYHQRWPEPNERACALLEKALLRRPDDPTLLPAFALALARRFAFGGEGALERAFAVAERAIAIAPWSPEPHLAWAVLEAQLAHDEDAVRYLRTALRLAPWHPESHARMGEHAAEAGLIDEAERHLTIAAALEPALDAPARWTRARLSMLEGDVADADRTLGPPPHQGWMQNHYFLLRARFLTYDPTPARLAAFRAALAPCAFDLKYVSEIYLSALETRSGLAELLTVLERSAGAARSKRQPSFFHTLRCELLAFAGRRDEAVEALRQADGHGVTDAFWIDRCRLLDPLRDRDAFRAIAATVRARGARVAEVYRQA